MGWRGLAASRLSRCMGSYSGVPDLHPESTGKSVKREKGSHLY